MYTGVNDIMRLDREPGSSLDEVLLTASLKVLTTDQFSAELVVSAMVCEPICTNQVARTALLATMPRWTMLTSLQCRGATSPAVWSSSDPAVRLAPLEVTVVAAPVRRPWRRPDRRWSIRES
jgi:hypothetical protein